LARDQAELPVVASSIGGRDGTSLPFDRSRIIDVDDAIDIATFSITPAEIASIGHTVLTGYQKDWPPGPPQIDRGLYYCGFPGTGPAVSGSIRSTSRQMVGKSTPRLQAATHSASSSLEIDTSRARSRTAAAQYLFRIVRGVTCAIDFELQAETRSGTKSRPTRSFTTTS
jgi:hypothetical protein